MADKRKKRLTHYTIIVTSDAAQRGVREYHLSRRTLVWSRIIGFAAFVAIVCYITYTGITLQDSHTNNLIQAQQIAAMSEQIATLEAENSTLTDKVTVLSSTINTKVQDEEAMAAATEEQSMPNGFPLSGTATSDVFDEGKEESKTDESGVPYILFNASEGTNIIATGTGTVIAIDTDLDFGNKLVIDHGNGYQSIYRNSGKAIVKAGDTVLRGAVLFTVSDDNKKLCYEIKQDENYIDPMDMIEING